MDKLDLKSLVNQYPGCMDSRAKLRATLLDCYVQPEHRRDINIALAIYESGLLPKIREKDSLNPRETAAMCDKIESEYGIPPELAVKAIIAWGEVWGTSVSATISPAQQSAPSVTKPAAEPAAPKPITPVQGSVSEYVIEEREEGWFITKFQGFEQENMTIPNIIDGKMIVGLEGGVFQYCREIKTIIVPEGIRFLREASVKERYGRSESAGVFESCSIEQIQLPNSLQEIGEHCFKSSGLKSIIVPNGVTCIGKKAFRSCYSLSSVDIPDTVVDIGASAFSDTKLSSIVLPKHLKKISHSLCSSCDELSSVVIPDGCQCIEAGAFINCRNLKEIRIPPSVTQIEDVGLGLKTIYCAPGSAAMEYARKHGIQCRPL